MCGIWSLVSMVSVVLCCGKISELSAQNIVNGFEWCTLYSTVPERLDLNMGWFLKKLTRT